MPRYTGYLSAETNKIIKGDVDKCITKYCKEFGVEEALVRAVIRKESNDRPFALRYEPHLRRAKWYRRLIPAQYMDDKYAYCSMGYTQILYGIALSEGFTGTPHELLAPENCIKYSAKYLKTLIRRYYYLNKVVSAYNQGTPRRMRNQKGKMVFRNQAYVNVVLRYYRQFGGRVQ